MTGGSPFRPVHRTCALAVALVLAWAGCFSAPAEEPGEPPGPAVLAPTWDLPPGEPMVSDLFVPAAHGTTMPVTIIKPHGVDAAHPAPIILLFHGGAENRQTALGHHWAGALVDAGFGVLAMDMRGHGEHPELFPTDHTLHVDDAIALLDWVHDELDWVVKQPGSSHERDIVAGSWGFSLGGIMQHTAAWDGRFDALVPMDAWTSMRDTFYPNEVVASYWASAFGAVEKADMLRWDPAYDDALAYALQTERWPDWYLEAGDAMNVLPIADQISVPTLLVQGVPDTTWPLNDTVALHDALRENGTTTHLVTWLGGHTGNLAPGTPILQPLDERTPCGNMTDLFVAWFDTHLRGGPVPELPPISYAFDDGTCRAYDTAPIPNDTHPLGDTTLIGPAAREDLTVTAVNEATYVAGAPRLRFDATVSDDDEVLFFSLIRTRGQDVPETVSGQVTPWRLTGNGPVDIPLKMVGGGLAPGDTLDLRIERQNPFFATHGERNPLTIVTLSDIELDLHITP